MVEAISTHTLTWSVTRNDSIYHDFGRHFNSHAHVERDLYILINRQTHTQISTHTLTWSVTTAFDRMLERRKISTHTLTWSVTQGQRQSKRVV